MTTNTVYLTLRPKRTERRPSVVAVGLGNLVQGASSEGWNSFWNPSFEPAGVEENLDKPPAAILVLEPVLM